MDPGLLSLKSKVLFIQLEKAKSALSSESDQFKHKALALKQSFDKLKSKKTLHSLVLKKKLADATTSLADSRLVWVSELINLKNSAEIFQAAQERKKIIKEQLFENLQKIRPLLESLPNFLEEKENVFLKSCLDESCGFNESTMAQTMNRSIDSLRDKGNDLGGNSGVILTAVDEKIEISFDTENGASFSSDLKTVKTEQVRLSMNNEEINDSMIGFVEKTNPVLTSLKKIL